MTELLDAIRRLESFSATGLTKRIADLEAALANSDLSSSSAILERESISPELLQGAYLLKRTAGQINVIIHALGILLALPRVLQPGERVEYLSLGAGNTGRDFDLETSDRIAEFKFIHWQGGPETIRQNAIFKDFFLLAEHATSKRKYLYVLGTTHPLKFLQSKRSLASIMSRRLEHEFRHRFGDRFNSVGEYYSYRRGEVRIEDLGPLLGEHVPPPDSPIES